MDARTPAPARLGEQLATLGLDKVDADQVIAWSQDLGGDDHSRVDELVQRLVDGREARITGREARVFEACDDEHRLGTGVLPLLALVQAAPRLAGLDLADGYPDEVVRTTQADIGQQLRKFRTVHGRTGLDTQWWLAVVLGAGFARLGRLQFEVTRSDLGMGEGHEVPVLSVHIPGDGPLEPDAVDDSLVQASTFFEEHHPDLGPIDWFICESWLLDPALAHLVPGSNIAAFCARWDVWKIRERDRDALYFGFDVEPPSGAEVSSLLGDLPTDTRLHVQMVEHWRAGEHFMLASGRLPVIRQLDEK